VRYQAWDTATNQPIWTVTGVGGVFSYADQVFYVLSDYRGVSVGRLCSFSPGRPTLTAYSMTDATKLWSMQLPEFSGGSGGVEENGTDPTSGAPRAITTLAYFTQRPDADPNSDETSTVLVDVRHQTAQTVDAWFDGFGTQTAHFKMGIKTPTPSLIAYDTLSGSPDLLWTIKLPALTGDTHGVWINHLGPWLIAMPSSISSGAKGMSVLREK